MSQLEQKVPKFVRAERTAPIIFRPNSHRTQSCCKSRVFIQHAIKIKGVFTQNCAQVHAHVVSRVNGVVDVEADLPGNALQNSLILLVCCVNTTFGNDVSYYLCGAVWCCLRAPLRPV